MAANLALSFAFYLLTPLLPLYLSETFHASKDTIGLVLSGYTVAALVFRPFSGYIVDSFNRKVVLVVCYAFFFAFFGGYLLAGTLLAFAIVRTLHGGPFGALTVANSTVAIDVLPSSRRNEGIGYYGLSNNLGMAVAPILGVTIYRLTHNFQLLFWIALAVACLGMAIDSTVKIPEKERVRHVSRKVSLDRFILLKGWLIGANLVFFGLCFGVMQNYLAIYGKEVLGSSGGTGTFFLALSAGLAISRLTGAKWLRQGRLVHNAAIGTVLASAGYVLFIAWVSDFSYYLSAFLIGLGNGQFWPAFQNMAVNVADHDERGTANSTILVSWDIGIGLGILIGGFVSEHAGYSAAFWTVAAVQLAGTTLFFTKTRQFWLARRRPM